MKINNKGFSLIAVIILMTALVGGYFGYDKVYKPMKVENKLREQEITSLQTFEGIKNSGAVNFVPILPKYVPEGYYLDPVMGPYINEASFQLTYKDSKKMRIDIFEENLTSERKARFFKDQEIFPRPTKELKNGVIAYLSDSGEVSGKDKSSGVELIVEMREYKFLIGDIKISISTANMATIQDIEKMANSMIE
ncbi:MAG: hypothetical protein Q8P20_08225 [bacterium]|nr:hypothetical protein [bacterium]